MKRHEEGTRAGDFGHQRVKHRSSLIRFFVFFFFFFWQYCVHTLCIRISIDLRMATCHLLFRQCPPSVSARDHLQLTVSASRKNALNLRLIHRRYFESLLYIQTKQRGLSLIPFIPFPSCTPCNTYPHALFHCCVNKIYNLINNLHA